MNRQERRAAAKKNKSAKFLFCFAYDHQTGESRMQVMENTAVVIPLGNETSQFMLKKYIALNRDLTPLEMFHFTNWCISHKSDSKVTAQVIGCETLEQGEACIAQYRKMLARGI